MAGGRVIESRLIATGLQGPCSCPNHPDGHWIDERKLNDTIVRLCRPGRQATVDVRSVERPPDPQWLEEWRADIMKRAWERLRDDNV
jgi:hypothetical protein